MAATPAVVNVAIVATASPTPAVALPAGLPSTAQALAWLQALDGRVADFCRKCTALSDAQQRAGDSSTALSSLGHCTALLLQLGFDAPAAWQPLVQAFVRGEAVFLRVKEIGKRTVTFTLNKAETTVTF